jgi:lipopolysaccharide export LptBFGC system permease protein LptF
MSTRVDIEEIQTTKTEKFLAGVLAVFLLIAGIWAYQKVDDYIADAIEINALLNQPEIIRLDSAQDEAFRAQQEYNGALRNLELRREAYRTALDEGRKAPQLRHAYNRAQARLASAQRAVGTARAEVQRARPAAEAAQRRASAEIERRQHRRELYSFLLRLALSVASIIAAFGLLFVLHRRRSRYLPLALGAVAAATILAFVLAGDYVTDYVDPLDLGVLFLGLFGALVTVLAFAALQWYLRRRLPARRVRRRLCPFCGYPVAENEHCEGCGRDVIAPCARCNEPRRVGARFCGVCGAA